MAILSPEFAQKFIQKTVKNLPYNVNIMNHDGIIIASKDDSRIGDFHEVAYGLLHGTLDSGIVTPGDDYIGTKPGINMFVDYKEKHIGVICVTGDPKNVNSFAGFVKSSLETMLDYEIQASKNRDALDESEKFLHYSIFDEEFNNDEALELCERYSLQFAPVTTIILIRSPYGINRGSLLRTLKEGTILDRRDIAIRGWNDDVVVLKNLKGDTPEAVKEYREQIFSCIWQIEERAKKNPEQKDLNYFVGSLQSRIDQFRTSYLHAQQLAIQPRPGAYEKVTFFLDHIQDYIRNSVTLKLYKDIFASFHPLFPGDEKEVMVETIKALEANNYNLVHTSKALHVHRNTITFRLKKLKSLLNIDPLDRRSDREFLRELAHYLDRC